MAQTFSKLGRCILVQVRHFDIEHKAISYEAILAARLRSTNVHGLVGL